MSWTNYHGHSDYCDGHGKIEDYITKAIDFNMSAIGISSHAPVPCPTDWNMPKDKLVAYISEIETLKNKYKGKIAVYKSLEVDFIPNMMSPTHSDIKNIDLDYVIGSVHYIDQFEDGTPWDMDGSDSQIKKGYEEIFHSDFKNLALKYFSAQKEMLQNHAPDILGHMDKIKVHNQMYDLADPKESWFANEVKETLLLAKEQGVIVEINTKVYNHSNLIFPGRAFFQFIRENDIPITMNSDAHMAKFLIAGYEDVAGLLLDNSITHLHEFIEGQWQPVKFNTKGLIFK
ncbi:histidinol-phosphatase [Carboxylicivirga sp. N1Y90]|uniref:histidinol-phosphatase n=1 Tax=Carboxylicivirga fragile TaxID=3417571 RepID=UPI003D33D3DA|nr:histidinol-phosphatase [Marinilabiliaceae bacterium N1Y90]